MSTDVGDIVLDPFGGGGTTYQVAEKHGRNWIGVEIGPCEPIIERLQYFVHAQFGELPSKEVLGAFITQSEQ